jgi:sugar phosphate isomerase/epimerase
MLREILDLGFDAVELGHGVRIPLMEGIQKLYDAGGVKISSLHNFCPLPIEITRAAPDCYEFSSHRDHERERAVRLTFQTIDFARRLGAGRVVLHMGSVAMDSFTEKLIKMANEGRQQTKQYVAAKLKAVKIREKKSPFYIERVTECLKRILDHAAQREVVLGMEGRFAYEEIPSETEFPALLRQFDSPWVGYWHDFGHIQVKENLGFVDHAAWLRQVSHRLVGAHLHDTIWPDRDHQPPLQGQIDYDRLIPILPAEKLLVWEMSPRRKADEIAESLQKWKERFGQ